MLAALDVSTVSTFVALLALACWVLVVAVVVASVITRGRPGAGPIGAMLAELSRAALPLAWIIAMVTMLGSLYYSRVQHYVPCELCWYQRICIYPFAVILGIAAWRRDATIRIYALPVLTIGAVIAAYHSWVQAYPPADGTSFCTADAPCTLRYVWEFGFVSLPFMALSACIAMIALLLIAHPASRPIVSTESP